MARATIVLSDEDEGFELAMEVTFEPEIPKGTPASELPTPYITAFMVMEAVNALSASGGADYLAANDEEPIIDTRDSPYRPI